LVFTPGENGPIEVLIEWMKWAGSVHILPVSSGHPPSLALGTATWKYENEHYRRPCGSHSLAGKNIGMQPRPEAVLGEGEHLRLLAVLLADLLPDGDDLLGGKAVSLRQIHGIQKDAGRWPDLGYAPAFLLKQGLHLGKGAKPLLGAHPLIEQTQAFSVFSVLEAGGVMDEELAFPLLAPEVAAAAASGRL